MRPRPRDDRSAAAWRLSPAPRLAGGGYDADRMIGAAPRGVKKKRANRAIPARNRETSACGSAITFDLYRIPGDLTLPRQGARRTFPMYLI